MRAVLGVGMLLVVVLVIGLLAKKQLASVSVPAILTVPSPAGAPAAGGTPKQQMDQLKQGVEATLQQPRPSADDNAK